MSGNDVMRLGKFDNNDITETLLDYCDCGGHGCEPCYAAEVIRRLRAEVEWLSRALRYISSPTMGLPGGADAAEFCMKGATEQAVRTALRVCIEMARQAMEARRA